MSATSYPAAIESRRPEQSSAVTPDAAIGRPLGTATAVAFRHRTRRR